MDIAVVGAGVSLTVNAKGVCTAARVALGAVAARALMVKAAAKALIGTTVDDAALDKLAAVGFGRRQADRRQARHQGIPNQGGRACSRAAPRSKHSSGRGVEP